MNMWFADDKQHSFFVKTPKYSYLPSAKARLVEKEIAEEKITIRLESNKRKENIKFLETLHRDQLCLKGAQTSDQNSIIKSLRDRLKII